MTHAPGLRIHALETGRVVATGTDADEFADDGAYAGRTFQLPIPAFLVRHPDGDLVWDTGMSQTRTDLGDWATAGPSLTAELATVGVAPGDVRFVSLSHGHWDHSGNAGLFAAATWIVNPAERAVMFDEVSRASAAMDDYGALENATTRFVSDDHDVFGDGSVVIVQAPGHTVGHSVLLVRLPAAGPVVLSGDLWHLVESRTHRRVPTFNVDRAQTLASMDKVDAIAASLGARVIVQHDPTDFAAIRRLPEGLR